MDRDKTEFTSHYGLYRIIRMFFELKNTIGKFQRIKNAMLAGVKLRFSLVYLDDIVIYSKSPGKHIGHASRVSTLSYDTDVNMRLKMSELLKERKKYFGLIIPPRHLGIAVTYDEYYLWTLSNVKRDLTQIVFRLVLRNKTLQNRL